MSFRRKKYFQAAKITILFLFSSGIIAAQSSKGAKLPEGAENIARSIKKAYEKKEFKSLLSFYGTITEESQVAILSVLSRREEAFKTFWDTEDVKRFPLQVEIEVASFSEEKIGIILKTFPVIQSIPQGTYSIKGKRWELRKIFEEWYIWDNQVFSEFDYEDSPVEISKIRVKEVARVRVNRAKIVKDKMLENQANKDLENYERANVLVVETKNKTSLVIIIHRELKKYPPVSLKLSLADTVNFTFLSQIAIPDNSEGSESSIVTIYEVMASKSEFELKKENFNSEGFYFSGNHLE